MIREILNANDTRLRQVSKPVKKIDKKILALIKELKETLVIQKDPEGIGLAAPQIGRGLRIFIMMPGKEIKTIINPKILSIKKISKKKKKKSKNVMEGCLSLPNFYSPLNRDNKVTVKYMSENWKEIIETFEGIEAQIVQHEIDHLNGILFIDRLLEQKKPLYEYIDGEWEKVEL